MAVETKVIDVKGMTCGHCASTVERSVKELEGIETVNVDLSSNKVTVSFDDSKVQLTEVNEAIVEAGYQVA